MASSRNYPKPELDRKGDTLVLTVPAWHGKPAFIAVCAFALLLPAVWIPAFFRPLLSEWIGSEPTLSGGRKVSGWIWTLFLLGLPYYALYQLKGRLLL